MILDIRGGLGTQVLELMLGIAKAGVNNETIDEIRINVGGNVVDTVRYNYISDLFAIPVPITISQNVLKQNVWTEEHFELLCELELNNPRSIIKFNKQYKQSLIQRFFFKNDPNNVLIHVRGKDRQVASEWNYQIMINRAIDYFKPIQLVGDDQNLISRVKHGYGSHIENVSSSPTMDFVKCIESSVLISSFSSFTIAAMMFDPNKEFLFLSKETASGPYKELHDKHYRCVDILMRNKFKNGSYI